MDATVILGAVGGIGILVAIGVAFLLAGDRLSKQEASDQSRAFLSLHLMAIVAATIGGALAWMAFATDHPSKWKQLALPLVFVGVVYGYALKLNSNAWTALLRDIRERFRK
jgi:prolipoprotein diacylglyceryltransferase